MVSNRWKIGVLLAMMVAAVLVTLQMPSRQHTTRQQDSPLASVKRETSTSPATVDAVGMTPVEGKAKAPAKAAMQQVEEFVASAEGKTGTRTALIAYNAHGRMTREELYSPVNGQLSSTSTYLYNAQGRKIETLMVIDGGIEPVHSTYTYDARGHVTEERAFMGKELMERIVYHNDAAGRAVRVVIYNGNGTYASSLKMRYDAKGQCLEEQQFSTERETMATLRVSYTYDDHGNIATMTSEDIDAGHTEKITYTYVYDQHGNWTKRIAIIGTATKPSEVTTRVIRYY